MLERTSYYRDDYAYDDDYRPGLMTRIFGSALRHPWRTAVSVTLVVAATAIVANAVFFQSGEHPSPFFSTRDEAEAPAVPVAEPGEEALAADNPPVDAIGRLVEVTTANTPQVQTNAASVTVVEVQQLLAALGYEPGIVDGLFGARTRSAIEAFQSENGLAVTGEITDDLVTALRAASPEPTEEEAAAPRNEGNQILAVQTALNLIGYGPVTADGEMTNETAEAVRGFQLEYGLPVTGQIDQMLIDRMVAIGALVRN